jgi:hypothetical protein
MWKYYEGFDRDPLGPAKPVFMHKIITDKKTSTTTSITIIGIPIDTKLKA